MYDVRAFCARVVGMADHVRIADGAGQPLATDLARQPTAAPPWGEPHLVDAPAEQVAGWTLLLSALNFCFWQEEPRWRVGGHDGYLALALALRRAHDAGVPVSDPAWYARWSVDDLRAVLLGDR